MENLKIRVANEAESREAQELFFKLGYYWAYRNLGKTLHVVKEDIYLFAENNGIIRAGTIQGKVFFDNWSGREITLQELRDMVNPVKEYLEPSNNYSLIKAHRKEGNDWIEVPEGAEKYIQGVKYPKRFGFVKGTNFWDGEWIDHVDQPHEYTVVWNRHTQPEELPFLDSINDQYAEVEQVRKQTIEATLAERQAQYGCFEDVARTTGKIMEALAEVRVNGLDELPYPHRMALYMIASKMARIVNGDYNHKDSWHDIGGYSKLIEDLL